MVTADDRKHPMNPWIGVALANVALFVAAGWRAAHRGDGAWWRSVVHDPVAMTVGGMVGIATAVATLAAGDVAGLPSAAIVAVTVAALVGRWRTRRADRSG